MTSESRSAPEKRIARLLPSQSRGLSPRERVGPKLEACRLRPVGLTALEMEHCPGSRGGPQRLTFPAGVRIVDAAIHIFGEESAGVWDTEGNELPVDQGVNRSEEHTSELQSLTNLVCRLLLEKK